MSWKDLPDIEPARSKSWKDLPDVPVATESDPAPEPKVARASVPGGAPSQGGAAFRAATGSALQNFGDELAGKTYEVGSYLRNLLHGTGVDEAEGRRQDDYRHGRDTTRQVMEQDREAFPKTVFGAGVAGDAATQAIMAAATGGATLTPGGMALTGGLSGLGASEADLTKGEYGRAALDSGGMALVSGSIGKLGEKLIPGAKGFIQKRIGRATGDAAAEVERKAAKELAAGYGKVGGATAAGRNAVEVAQEIVSSPHALPEQVADAKAFLASPAARELLRGVYESALDQAPRKLGALASAHNAMPPLQHAATPGGLAQATEERLSGAGRRIASKWPHALNKLMPLAAGALGFSTGHEVIGGLAAGAMALGSGRGGTVVKNLISDPAVRRAAWSATESALRAGGQALGKYGPYLAREYQRDPENARAIDEALMSEEPGYAEEKLKMLQGSSP